MYAVAEYLRELLENILEIPIKVVPTIKLSLIALIKNNSPTIMTKP